MPLTEIILAAIADAVIGCAFEKSSEKLGDWARDKFGLDATKKAFKEALGLAFERLEKQHHQWVANYFDASFFEHEGAPILAQFLVRDGHPDASELAARWADSLNLQEPERRAFYTRELEPIAADFLANLAHLLKGKAALLELHNSRAFEQSTEALQALRQKLGAEKATFGTRRDYLRWLIGRNFYLDPRGTFQTQRQVQVKLDEIYISLQAQRDDAPSIADRLIFEKELAELEVRGAIANLAPEEVEDKREQLQRHFEKIGKSGEILELSEVVTHYDRVVILGDPGSGKSTLLRYLALKHADALWNGRSEAGEGLGMARFPILIRIAEYAEDGTWKKKSLSDFLTDSNILHDCPRHGLADLLQTELEIGNCLVLLDGLDEIVSADERLGVVKQIEDFVRHHISKANRFVITSRKAGYRSAQLAEPFTHFTVKEMDEVQISHFLERWCQAVEDVQTPELSLQERRSVAKREIDGIMRAVQTSPGVRRLATNPLLLRTLALIHRVSAQLPQKRIELYKLAADTLARTWRTAQGVTELALVKEEYLTPLLSKLAFWLHVHKPTGTATQQEVYEVLGEEWAHLNDLHWDADDPSPKITEEVKRFLVAVREHTGLFVERAPKRYGFMHLTFEEYFVARYLVARNKIRAKLLRQYLHQPRWEEPILLALGFIGLDYPVEASELVEVAILAKGEEAQELNFAPSLREDLLCRDYLFALRCLGDDIPVRPRLQKQLIERLADELLHNTGPARFQRYRQALGERLQYLGSSAGGFALLSILTSALSNLDSTVRANAASSLGKLGNSPSEVITALIACLHDKDSTVRANAASSLGELGNSSPEVIIALIACLHDKDSAVRANAASSLGELGNSSSEVITALIACLRDKDFSVSYNARKSLGELGNSSPEVITALIACLHDKDSTVRADASLSLGRLNQPSPEVITALTEGLQDEGRLVRFYAAESLERLDRVSLEVITALTEGIYDIGFRRILQDVADLGQFRQVPSEVITALIVFLHDEDPTVRSKVAWSIGQLGNSSPEVIVALKGCLQDKEPAVQSSAALSLGNLGYAPSQVTRVLLEGLDTVKNRRILLDSVRLLGRIDQGDQATMNALWRHLLDNEIGGAYAQALAQLGRRFPTATQEIETKFVQAIQDSESDRPDSANDAYSGLWLLMSVDSEIEDS